MPVGNALSGFAFANWELDLQDVLMTKGLICAELCYIAGCIFFLPKFNVSTMCTNIASALFVAGSVIITASAISHAFHAGVTAQDRPISRKMHSPRALRTVGYYSPHVFLERQNSRPLTCWILFCLLLLSN